MTEEGALLAVRNLDVEFRVGARAVRVLHDVTLDVGDGQTVGLVGESGSGKSTLAKAIIGTVRPAAGRIALGGLDLAARGARARVRRRIQLIPQDPYASLNPRMSIGVAMAEALDPGRPRLARDRDEIVSWLERVSLPADAVYRYPHQFSGGQRQRIALARGLITRPEVVIADEITSALDVSVQAEVLDLLADLQRELRVTVLFISHNLAVVRQVCEEVAVMYRGRIVERGASADVFDAPRAAYTRQLLAAVPGSPGFSLR